MTKGRFSKGQRVFYAATSFGSLYDRKHNTSVEILTVIERTADACGKKQMTFEDHGNDSVYGRTAYAPFNSYFETREDAYKHLETIEDYTRKDGFNFRHIIMRGEFDDRNKEVFDIYRSFYGERKERS